MGYIYVNSRFIPAMFLGSKITLGMGLNPNIKVKKETNLTLSQMGGGGFYQSMGFNPAN